MLAVILKLIAGIILVFIVIHYIYYIYSSLRFNEMQSEDAKFIKKRWKGGSIEPHPTEKALVVQYKLEAAVFNEPGDPMLEDKKDCQRIIRLRSLNAKTDVATLAKEVVDKCDLIHKSQQTDVEQIIFYLKNRKEIVSNDMVTSSTDNNNIMANPRNSAKLSPAELENASIRNVDEYIELLYEDLADRIKGSAYILQLARNPDNLEELEKNEAVLSALSRVLREDWRKSLDLSTNIIYIFFCFSTYTHFHSVIVQYKIGSLCMDVIDYELKRYDQMKIEMENLKNPDSVNHSTTNRDFNRSQNLLDAIMNEEKPKDMEPPRRRIPELKQRPKSGNWSSYHGSMSSSLVKSRTLNNSYHENITSDLEFFNETSGDQSGFANSEDNRIMIETTTPTKSAESKNSKEDYEKLNKQLKLFAKKQEQLLRVAYYLLLNIAENVKVEEKMRKKNIVKMLVKTLERQNIDLLVLIITFLKKLSIVRDNKDEMFELNIVEKLPRLLQSSHPDLIQVTLKLIFNLSFDAAHRSKMIRVGFLPKLVTFLSDEKHEIVIKILYHMSLDDKVKSMFAYTDCIPLVVDMLILNLSQRSDFDLIALCINLALNKRNAQIMVENSRLHSLMSRAFKYEDTLIMKLLRNISHQDQLRIYFINFVGDLAKIITICENEDFIVECVGILGNLALPDLDYSQILHNFNLIPWIRNILVPGKVKDDLVLDSVVFLGTCACDELCAMLLCKADVILSLIELLKAKQEDDEMVLQIVFVFQQILKNESTRNYMIKETESPAYLIDLMHDKNTEIRKVCDYCLDIIAFTNSEWASRIKLEKFRNHNAQWLSMVESQADQEDSQYFAQLEDEDSDLPPYLTSGYLEQCMLYQSGETNPNEESDTILRATSAMSNYSRPVSRYSRDFEEFDNMTSSSKSRQSVLDENLFNINKSNSARELDFSDNLNEEFLVA